MRLLCCLVPDLAASEPRWEAALSHFEALGQPVESPSPGLAFVDITALVPLFAHDWDLVPRLSGPLASLGLAPRWSNGCTSTRRRSNTPRSRRWRDCS